MMRLQPHEHGIETVTFRHISKRLLSNSELVKINQLSAAPAVWPCCSRSSYGRPASDRQALGDSAGV